MAHETKWPEAKEAGEGAQKANARSIWQGQTSCNTGVGYIWTPQKDDTMINEASCIIHINAVPVNIIWLFCTEWLAQGEQKQLFPILKFIFGFLSEHFVLLFKSLLLSSHSNVCNHNIYLQIRDCTGTEATMAHFLYHKNTVPQSHIHISRSSWVFLQKKLHFPLTSTTFNCSSATAFLQQDRSMPYSL